jgi:hypothetical protein
MAFRVGAVFIALAGSVAAQEAPAGSADPAEAPPATTPAGPTPATTPAEPKPEAADKTSIPPLPSLPAGAGAARPRQGKPVVGTGKFHPFDKEYLLAGINLQGQASHGAIVEFESSYVPFISDNLAWLGFWGAIGGHTGDNGDFRGGAGLEFGWRFLAFDGGYIYDASEADAKGFKIDEVGERVETTYADEHGVRLRVGASFAQETFTSSCARYAKDCCITEQEDSWTNCECNRTPAGVALFIYWANEWRFDSGKADNMLGLSLKFGVGLGE